MATEPIAYVQPTSRAFDGMKRILFQPFDIGKWFVIGFTAWLAGLLDHTSSSSGSSGGSGGGGGSGSSLVAQNDAASLGFQDVIDWSRANQALAEFTRQVHVPR